VSGAIVPIRRADRLFDILRILRSAKAPVTAASIADELEVTVRTVCRDVATLQARRVPIEGAAGSSRGRCSTSGSRSPRR
jgi:predicted DNA-binding transcriptional regulator YafY